ncbi:copper-binding protein [Variovorax sp. KK3]|uniref:copper-binding protein n=1 Tax=Variovorax sp. KK3 TaxID=1855728 RepID=UPI00097C00D1|nr:copper-binding protein [Variovorax sp. KK3]
MTIIKHGVLRHTCVALVTLLALAGSAHAQTAQTADRDTGPTTVASASADLVDGEVRKVDKDNAKITLKHGPLKNLDMPGMTMVFGVGEPAMLERVQVGDKIRFVAEKVDGKFTLVRIEPQP